MSSVSYVVQCAAADGRRRCRLCAVIYEKDTCLRRPKGFNPFGIPSRSRGVMFVRIQQKSLFANKSPPDALALIYGQACRADGLLCRQMRIP